MSDYIPKGGICVSCKDRWRDCRGLPFHTMRVIKRYPDGTKAVKCDQYQRMEQPQ